MNSMAEQIKEREANLETSLDRFQAITDTAVYAIVVIDSSDKIRFWNPAAERIFDYRSSQVMGRDLTVLIPERFWEAHRDALVRRVAGGPSQNVGKTIEATAVRNGGEEFPITLSLAQWEAPDGFYFSGLIRDITERKQIEAALKTSEERFRTLVENASECICQIDLEGNFQFMSPAGLESHGMVDLDEVIGLNMLELAESPYHDLLKQKFEQAKLGETVRFQYESETVDGVRWFESVVSPQYDSDGKLASVIRLSSDITDRQRAQEKLQYVSTHDLLTDLNNRATLFSRLREEVARTERHGGQFSWLILDIDNFKKVNDTYGHPAGDIVLHDISTVLKEEIRESDIVGRYGGEEFVVLMPQTGLETAMQAAERIRIALAARKIPVAPGKTISVSASAGVAVFPETAHSAEELVGQADEALYLAKEAGRNRVRMYRRSA